VSTTPLQLHHPLEVLSELLWVSHKSGHELPDAPLDLFGTVVGANAVRRASVFAEAEKAGALVVSVDPPSAWDSIMGHARAARAAPHSPSRELPKASTGVARCPIIPDHLSRGVHNVARYAGVWYRDRYPLLARVLAHVMSRPVFAPVWTSDRHLLARGARAVEPEDTVALGFVQSRSHLRGDHRRDLGVNVRPIDVVQYQIAQKRRSPVHTSPVAVHRW
jgi:hypothetical protein